jgi:hypothetical protein
LADSTSLLRHLRHGKIPRAFDCIDHSSGNHRGAY